MSKVSKKLKADLITKAGRSVTDLARELGMSRPALSNVLNGSADLSMELAIKLESSFGMSASKLLMSQLTERLEQIRAEMNEVDDD